MNRMIAMTISPGGEDGGRTVDGVGEGLAHHPAARRDQDEEEGPKELRDEAPPLLLPIRGSRDAGWITSTSNQRSTRAVVPDACS